MNRRTISLLLALGLSILTVQAQDFSPAMQQVYKTCLQMRQAFASGSQSGLGTANRQLKQLAPSYFASCRIKRGDTVSLNGHYLFDCVFVDSLIANKQVYKKAQDYALRYADERAESTEQVSLRNFALRKGGSLQLVFTGKGKTDIAVVAEPHAKVTLRVTDKDTGKSYSDAKQANRGMASRTCSVPVPGNETHTLYVEVINCSRHDISFALIKN